MKIILKEDMPNLGFKGEIVDVKPGYGRNFLIPQGKAIIASESAIKILQENQRQQARKMQAELDKARKYAEKIEGTKLTFEVKTSNAGRIYGSVNSSMVADKLEELGFAEINRKMLVLPNIKEVGEYAAKVRLHKDVTVEVPVTVVSDEPIVKAAPVEQVPVAEETSVEEATEETTEE
ncbi:50S ribosomal protein L9 [Porphyromonas levii]|uniref:Large ribosomal subunit protein bL9 n=1 Tax=Porphyromonas levii TaxID=28114 RepID=A0A4Y8WRV4_9PORP|nr:50S ribosomal protein L9 [Porphyromonas levii]MBR8703415.1 50S ribosomal protein L9 [Porphyromonas levii]MBR8712613.1 50S ribosomal protein L9 [Porphyromonas levii]MBR8714605.1 50S ribosomal protein L9 [Porphyromonas levii]MBR8727114.1 50S ribosomal protein L9 [Porphyromonas levii]MBR8730017.1 50S ribosomal protein L9 [Porphyromonas levii]